MKFSSYETDLFVLPENADEHKRIEQFLKSRGTAFMVCHSDVVGQDWFARQFFDIPFMSCDEFRAELVAAVESKAD